MKEYTIKDYTRLFHGGNKAAFARAIGVAPQNVGAYYNGKQWTMLCDNKEHRLINSKKSIKI